MTVRWHGGFPYDVMQHTVDVAHVENGLDFSRSSLKLFYKEYVTGKLGRLQLK